MIVWLLIGCQPVAPLPVEQAAAPFVLHADLAWDGAPFRLWADGLATGEPVIFYASAVGPGPGPCGAPRRCLDIRRPVEIGRAFADEAGVASVQTVAPPGRERVWAQAATARLLPSLTPALTVQILPADHDWDADGASDLDELALGWDPEDADMDDDWLPDGEEAAFGTDPLIADAEDDGVLDGRERLFGTDPFVRDSDGDGVDDRVDMNPAVADPPPTFVIDDIEATDPAFDVRDPEFEEFVGRAVWTDTEGDELWVVNVNPNTGRFVPNDGRGELVDTLVAPIVAGRNGPEWAYSDLGARVVYASQVGDSTLLRQGVEDGAGGWLTFSMPGTEGFVSPIGSLDLGDPNPRVLYGQIADGVTTTGWREIGDPTAIGLFPLELRYARWVPGQRKIVCVAPAADGVEQVYTIDVDTMAVQQITFDPSWKAFTFFFAAPEWGGELAMFVAESDAQDAPTRITVWREQAGVWTWAHTITSPPGFPYLISPEPLITGGRSYVSYLASQEPLNRLNGFATVWVASLDAANPLTRLVSLGQREVRKDPEPYTAGARPWVFYTVVSGGRQHVRRAETGL